MHGTGYVPSPVKPDTAQASSHQCMKLVFPGVTVQQPGVGEYDGIARTPVLIEDLRAVGSRDETHVRNSLPMSAASRGWPYTDRTG
jgi:hypothetical protein